MIVRNLWNQSIMRAIMYITYRPAVRSWDRASLMGHWVAPMWSWSGSWGDLHAEYKKGLPLTSFPSVFVNGFVARLNVVGKEFPSCNISSTFGDDSL